MGRTRDGAKPTTEQKSYHWCFTWNNPPDNWKEIFLNWPNLGRDPVNIPVDGVHPGYLAVGLEVSPGTDTNPGTPHLQGFCSFACLTKVSTLKNIWRKSREDWNKLIQSIHWEVALHYKTWQEARLYGLKEGNDNLEFGVGSLCRKVRGKRSDLDIVRDAITGGSITNVTELQLLPELNSYAAYCFGKEMVRLQVPRHDFIPIIFWIYGGTGVGKSRYVREFIREMEIGRSWKSWISFDTGLKWFDNYEGQELALFDDFRAGGDFAKLLQITDRYLCRVPVKGSSVYWYPKYIFFTCNESIEDAFRANSQYENISQFTRRVTESGGGVYDFNTAGDITLFRSRLDHYMSASATSSKSASSALATGASLSLPSDSSSRDLLVPRLAASPSIVPLVQPDALEKEYGLEAREDALSQGAEGRE